MKKSVVLVLYLLICACLHSTQAQATAGDYSLRVKAGPSFNLQDWHTQARLGGEFSYDFGYSLGFDLLALFGISDQFRFDLVPNVRYDIVYIGPAAIYGIFGMGYGVFDTQSALDMRFGLGMTLPLGERFLFNTDANMWVAPVGVPGTPVTFDWLMAFGLRFH